MMIPEYREGDVVRPGRVIATVVDGRMEVQSNIFENDRANIAAGQAVEVRADALPKETFNGKVKTIAGLASRGMWWMGDSSRTFETTFEIERSDSRLKPAQTVKVIIAGNPLKSVLYVPTQAVFEKNGKPVVYAKTSSGFEPREVKVARRSEARVVLEGVADGTEVALRDPQLPATGAAAAKPAAAPSLGGGR